MKRRGPSCSWQQCAAPPSAPRIKLIYGLCCAERHRPRRATAPQFSRMRGRPERDHRTHLKGLCRKFRETGVTGVSVGAVVASVAMMSDRVIWSGSEFCCRT
jgi:hypothetical protein